MVLSVFKINCENMDKIIENHYWLIIFCLASEVYISFKRVF